MEPYGITIILLYVAAIVLAIWLLGKVFRVIFAIFLITVVLLGGIAFFVYKDVVDIKANAKEGLMAVLVDDGKILAGFAVEKEPIFFTQEQLSALSAQYLKKDYKAMLGNRFKLFIIDAKAIEALGDAPISSLGDQKEEGTRAITAKIALQAMRSENPVAVLSKQSPGVNLENGNPSEIKDMLLAAIFTRHFIQSPSFAVEQFKAGNIQVYPQSAVFRALHYVPAGLIKNLAGEAMEKGGEAKDAIIERIE